MHLSDGHIWFIFGEHRDGDVDIADSNNDTLLEKIPRPLAEAICDRHNEAVFEMEEHAIKREATHG